MISSCLPKNGDHPRGCGEHYYAFSADDFIKGSSPRMRGAPLVTFAFILADRIIPADAGSTWSRKFSKSVW